MLERGLHLRMLSHAQEWNELHFSMKERLHALWGTVMMGWLLGSFVN
jgi:hypothetical protein